jgi:hypothetical protein
MAFLIVLFFNYLKGFLMTTLSKSIINDAQFRTTTSELRRNLAKGNEHAEISAAFKAVSYNDHVSSYNARTIRGINLLFPQAEITSGDVLRYQTAQRLSNHTTTTFRRRLCRVAYRTTPLPPDRRLLLRA